jgi:hypothetical protein
MMITNRGEHMYWTGHKTLFIMVCLTGLSMTAQSGWSERGNVFANPSFKKTFSYQFIGQEGSFLRFTKQLEKIIKHRDEKGLASLIGCHAIINYKDSQVTIHYCHQTSNFLRGNSEAVWNALKKMNMQLISCNNNAIMFGNGEIYAGFGKGKWTIAVLNIDVFDALPPSP